MKTIMKLSGGNIQIDKKGKLTDDQMQAIKWYCLNHDGKLKIDFLSKTQIKQMTNYIFSECEKYGSSHSMRYTILRDYTKALITA